MLNTLKLGNVDLKEVEDLYYESFPLGTLFEDEGELWEIKEHIIQDEYWDTPCVSYITYKATRLKDGYTREIDGFILFLAILYTRAKGDK